MRVKMLKIECGPSGNFVPGQEREVSADHGRQLIVSGAAVAVSVVRETAAAGPDEIADKPAPQTASIAAPENRKKGKK